MTTPTLPPVRAPRLQGRGWLNTGGATLTLEELRGRFVLLDFWTFCCVNCLHVLDELRPLEERFAAELTVIGVHSPKFEHEADPEALADAVARYEVHHPVLDDPGLLTWRAYTAHAWPTLVLIDPRGYVVAQLSGEGHAPGLTATLERLVAEHTERGTLVPGTGPYVPPPPPEATAVRFPGGLAVVPPDRLPTSAPAARGAVDATAGPADEAVSDSTARTGSDRSGGADRSGGVLVSSTGEHQIVLLGDDLSTVLARYGSGSRGFEDGGPSEASFAEPVGLELLPPDVAARVGYDVLVADSANHAVRGLSLADGRVTTVAGTGRQLRLRAGEGPALEQDLSTPWDVSWWQDQAVIAMAGTHQLWSLSFPPRSEPPLGGSSSAPDHDPAAHSAESRSPALLDRPSSAADRGTPAGQAGSGRVAVLAGTSNEGLVDGSGDQAWLAQPSGLTVGGNGRLWVADSETSALRHLTRRAAEPTDEPGGDPRTGSPEAGAVEVGTVEVGTAVGEGLFDFGFRDGAAAQARFQHPLAVAALPDGTVAVADTYNGAVRRYDPVSDEVSTVASLLAEPAALAVEQGADGVTRLLVAESSGHRVVRIDVPERTDSNGSADGSVHRTERPAISLAPGRVELRVHFAPPPGQKLDDRWGDPTRLEVSSSPPELLAEGAGRGEGLTRTLRLAEGVTEGVLHVSVQAAACDVTTDDSSGTGDPEGIGAACHLYQQDWGVPVSVAPGGTSDLDLDLLRLT